jgi:hypothetical protein
VKHRIAAWAILGLFVVGCWQLYIFATIPIPISVEPIVRTLARFTCKPVIPPLDTQQRDALLPGVVSTNGRVKADDVLVDGKAERHPEGAYYIEWHDEGNCTAERSLSLKTCMGAVCVPAVVSLATMK